MNTETTVQISREHGTVRGESFLQRLSMKTKPLSIRNMKEQRISRLQKKHFKEFFFSL